MEIILWPQITDIASPYVYFWQTEQIQQIILSCYASKNKISMLSKNNETNTK